MPSPPHEPNTASADQPHRRPNRRSPADLSDEEIAASIDTARYPVILNPRQAAELLNLRLSTIYRHVSEGRYKAAVRRGKPLRFWRDRLIREFMRG